MIPPDDSFEHLIDPVKFIKGFKSKGYFKEWAKCLTIEDLVEAIKVYEKKQLYEHCGYMQEVIHEKRVNDMFSQN